jgi:hypothetical protein
MPPPPEPPGKRKTSTPRWFLPAAVIVALLEGFTAGYAVGDQATGDGAIDAANATGGADPATATEQSVPTGVSHRIGHDPRHGTTAAPESSLDSPPRDSHVRPWMDSQGRGLQSERR